MPRIGSVIPVSLSLARLRAFCWRFGTLGFAERVLASRTELLERELFGRRILIDVGRSSMHRLLFLEGERRVPEARLLAGLVGSGGTVVDVGANVGYYLMLFERLVGPTGRVICIEPEPENLVELKRNVALNGFENVEVHELAAGREAGEIRMRSGVNAALDPEGNFRVPLERVDSVVVKRVDLLKIDVEGHEWAVLEGGERLLAESRPALFLEVHPWLMPTSGDLERVLALVRCLYRRIEAFELRREQGAMSKMHARYLSPLRRLPAAEFARIDSGHSRPFWLACRA